MVIVIGNGISGLDNAVCISLHTNILEKGMNLFVLPPVAKGVPMVNVLNCNIVASKFKPQSQYYIHFWTNNLGKGRNPLSPQLWVK